MSHSRKNIEEINQIPPDIPDMSAKEFAPLPDEFNRGEPHIREEKKKASSIRKVMLYLASIGVVTLGIITPIIRLNPPEETVTAEATATPVPAPTATAIITPMVKMFYPDVQVFLFVLTVMLNNTVFPILIGIPVIILMQEELGFRPCMGKRKLKE